MNELSNLTVFQHNVFGSVRTVIKDSEPWFVAVDVCKALELADTGKATSRLDADESTRIEIDHPQSPGKKLEVIVVNESGLYCLILGSRKKEAREFKRWVTHEVIPSIRKHGAYMTPETIEKTLCNPDFIIKLATALKEEQQKVAALTPKAEYCDAVLQSPSLIATSVIAKDYGMSAARFNRMLENFGIQYKRGGIWVLKADYQDKGYMKSETFKYEGSNETFW